MRRHLIAAFLSVLVCATAVADNTTSVGRIPLLHPNLGHTGGAALHTHMADIFTAVSNHVATRYVEYTAVANATLTTYAHNLGEPFADITVVLYSGTGSTKTRIADPAGAGWTIAANGGTPTLAVDVTTPGSGGPHSFSLEIFGSLKGMAVQSPASVAITGGTLSGVTIASPTLTGITLFQNPSGSQPSLLLSEDPDSGTNFIKVWAPDTLAADYTLTLPVDDGVTGQVLTTDGLGTLSWLNFSSSPTMSSATLRQTTLLQNTTGAQPILAWTEDPDNGTDVVNVQAPASLAATYTLTWPIDDGANGEFLTTNGSGVLSWSNAITSPILTNPTIRGTALLQNLAGSAPPILALSEDPDSGTDTISIQAPASITSYTLTLPVDDGLSGQVLSTDGAGVLSWASAATVPGTPGAVYTDGVGLLSEAQLDRTRGGTGVSSTATFPTTASTDADFVMKAGAQTITGSKTFDVGTTNVGTAASATDRRILMSTDGTSGTQPFIEFQRAATVRGLLGPCAATSDLITGCAANDFAVRANGAIFFSVDNGVNAVSNISTGGVLTLGHTAPLVRLSQTFNTNTASSNGGIAINSWSNASNPGLLDLNKSMSGTVGTHALVADGQALGAIVGRGSDGTAFDDAAFIRFEVDGQTATAGDTSDMPGRIGFFTTPDGSETSVEAVRINNAGDMEFQGGTGSAHIDKTAGSAATPSFGFVGDDVGMYRSAADTLNFATSGVSSFSISSTGANTFGPPVTNNFNGQRHTVSGALVGGNVAASADESGQLNVGSNFRLGAQEANNARTQSTLTGIALMLDTRTSDTAPTLFFMANQVGDSTTTTADVIASATANSAWTFGASGNLNNHTFNGSFASVGDTNGGFTSFLRNASGGSGAYTSFRLFNDQNSNVRTLELNYAGSGFSGSLLGGAPAGESGNITTTGSFSLAFGTANTARMYIEGDGDVFITETDGGGNVPHNCTTRSNTQNAVSVVANCNAGEQLTGGGCQAANSGYQLNSGYQTSNTQWTCTWQAGQATSNTAQVRCCVY